MSQLDLLRNLDSIPSLKAYPDVQYSIKKMLNRSFKCCNIIKCERIVYKESTKNDKGYKEYINKYYHTGFCKVIRINKYSKCEILFFNNEKHNTKYPSVTIYYLTGEKKREIWYYHNKIHNSNGPAWVGYNKDGSKKYECYYLNGNKVQFV